MKEVLLQGKNICKVFSQNGESQPVLNGINLEIFEGDFTVIMGASGAGKSTLLYSLSGMDRITSGEITYRDRKISGLSEKEMAGLRAKEFGFVFQQTHLVSNLTLFENVTVAGYVGGECSPKEVRQKASALLTQMHVDGAKDRLPFQTSGGEAQRAAIARAMMNTPGLIFADEPLSLIHISCYSWWVPYLPVVEKHLCRIPAFQFLGKLDKSAITLRRMGHLPMLRIVQSVQILWFT